MYFTQWSMYTQWYMYQYYIATNVYMEMTLYRLLELLIVGENNNYRNIMYK